jgi:hypothetical protein
MAKRKGLFESLGDALDELQEDIKGLFQEEPDQPVGGAPEPVTRRVSLIIHNPRVPGAGNERLNKVLRWNDPRRLIQNYIADMTEISHGYANYQIVEEVEVDKFPRKADGFVYRADDFVKAWQERRGFHDPDAVDYYALLDEFELIEKVNANAIDEVWLFAFPYAGYYESIMVGPGAFWCNAPPLKNTDHADRRFVIMGYNYQRGVGEMLENFGHRAESIMKRVYQNKRGDDNLWERFIRHEHKNPGQAEVGWMHYAPNSVRDYDWGNTRMVRSRWETWRNFPNLDGEVKQCNCADWGNGDIRLHHKWWFELLPHLTGSGDGVSYNWWKYIVDPNTVR